MRTLAVLALTGFSCFYFNPALANFDAGQAAKRLSFTAQGNGEPMILLSGFPETRHSWDHLLPILGKKYHTIAIDLPGLGDSPTLNVEYNTRNVAEIFHQFVKAQQLGPVHLVAHDLGAWVGFTWAAMYPEDFRSITLIDAGIPGITLKETVNLKDAMQRWHFLFQMLPDDLPAKMIKGKENIYYDWWFQHKVKNHLAISQIERTAYINAYSRPGRTEAALGYYQAILNDMEINRSLAKSPIALRVLGIGGESGSVPSMGETIKPFFTTVESVVIKNSGHYVPEEQPDAFLQALTQFLEH